MISSSDVRDPNTDTAVCARCKRTVRKTQMRIEHVNGHDRPVCSLMMAPSCRQIARETPAPNGGESNTAETVPK